VPLRLLVLDVPAFGAAEREGGEFSASSAARCAGRTAQNVNEHVNEHVRNSSTKTGNLALTCAAHSLL
jgi:hypothetical protein